jgi:uncharacterized protein
VVLADAGGLVALLDRTEPDHERCLAVVEEQGGPLFTTWPAVTEAMYLVQRQAAWEGVNSLWQLVVGGSAPVASQDAAAARRMYALMREYRDMPMALADASLVALAEERRETRILTLDSHYHGYVATWSRTAHGFQVLPQG